MLPAAIYARISSDPTGTELGVTRQLEDCRRLATSQGLRVAEEYVDDDRSAWSGKVRPAYRRMLDDLRAGSVGAVLIYHSDRLHRQPRELEEYIEVCEPRGVPTFACVSGRIDLSNPDGRLVARMLGAMAAHESDSRSRRIRRKHQELAEDGRLAGGGSRPFGYLADRRTVDPIEAAAVREAVARVLAGDSLRSVAADWNDRGSLSVSGGAWSIQVLGGCSTSARISGQRSLQGRDRGRRRMGADHHPGGDGAAARPPRTIAAPAASRTVRRYLLAGGLLRCGHCDAVLVSRPRGDGERRYVCAKGPGQPGCGRIGVMADPIEGLITEAVLYRLDTPELAAALAGAATEDAQASAAADSLAADQEQLAELARAYGERQITFPEFLAAGKPIEARIDAAKRHLSRLTHTTAIAEYVGALGRAAGSTGRSSRSPVSGRSSPRSSIVRSCCPRSAAGPASTPTASSPSGGSDRAARPRRRSTPGSRTFTGSPGPHTSARPTRARPRARGPRHAHDAHTAGGPAQPSTSSERHTPLGRRAHVHPEPSRGPRPRSGRRSGPRAAGSPGRPRTGGAPTAGRPPPGPCPRTSRGTARRAAPRRASPSPVGRSPSSLMWTWPRPHAACGSALRHVPPDREVRVEPVPAGVPLRGPQVRERLADGGAEAPEEVGQVSAKRDGLMAPGPGVGQGAEAVQPVGGAVPADLAPRPSCRIRLAVPTTGGEATPLRGGDAGRCPRPRRLRGTGRTASQPSEA